MESTKLAVDKLEEGYSRLLAVAGPPSACKDESDSPEMAEGVANTITCIRGVAQALLDADHLQSAYNTYARGYPDGPPMGPAALLEECPAFGQPHESLRQGGPLWLQKAQGRGMRPGWRGRVLLVPP